MSNYLEYNDKVAFHPGYYIKEIIEESGLTQEDFAKRLDTTPKNLSLLIRGEQRLSIDIAMKLSRLLGMSVNYWFNLQNTYDVLIAELASERELCEERIIFESLNYKYFKDNFGLPDLPRQKDEQIRQVRIFLNVATLSVLAKKDMAVRFRSSVSELSPTSIIKANTMVQIAANRALKVDTPKFDKTEFEKAIAHILALPTKQSEFRQFVFDTLYNAGVIFVVLPNLPGSKINGAAKKIGNRVMLMLNDKLQNKEAFCFTLFHEVWHILNGDYGISFEEEAGEQEAAANKYATEILKNRIAAG